MPEFLSDEWIAAFDELLAATSGAGPETVQIVHTVTGTPGGDDVTYTVLLSPEGSHVRRGAAADPTITFTCDHPTAVAVSRGDEQTQSVFLDGRLRVGGDTTALLALRPALAALGDLAEPLRRATTYPSRPPAESRA